MQLGVERYISEVTLASREAGPPWLVLPLCAVLVLFGLATVVNFRGIPERLHERRTVRQQGFAGSYDFQRFLGACFVLGGGWGILGTTWRLVTG